MLEPIVTGLVLVAQGDVRPMVKGGDEKGIQGHKRLGQCTR